MRQFKLINALNVEWDLHTKTSFLSEPAGLGFTQEVETLRSGYTFLEVKNELGQKTVSGKLVFNSYDLYSQFVAFCNSEPLNIYYKPGTEWYYTPCRILSLEKTELRTYLTCPVSFLLLGTWRKTSLISQAVVDDSDAKTYDYTYDYIYRDASLGTALISNTGLVSPCKINIFGPVINPHWSLFQDGVKLAEGEVTAVIPAGYKLVIDSNPETMEIAEYSISNVHSRNLYTVSDFDTARFISIPLGDSEMTFTHDGGGAMRAIVEVMQLVKSI